MNAERLRQRQHRQRGALMVEFAVISLLLYLLLAALLSFGTMIQAGQVAQDVARLAARELALTPLPATSTFEQALAATDDRIFDPNQLVVDLDAVANSGQDLDEHFAAMPLVNRALRPVFVFDRVGGLRLLRFPGALLRSPSRTAFNAGLTVGVPQVVARLDTGGERIRWLPVVEEIRPDAEDPASGPFSAVSGGPDRGLVALRINIPSTASALASYDGPTTWPPGANAGQPHLAGPVETEAGSVPSFGTPFPDAVHGGVLGAEQGLGEMGALGVRVRPFRRVFVGQALFRREVYQ
ncbi:MAG: TadE/TadG family type IV pilus assembly protein [Planctomycetota bacterium]